MPATTLMTEEEFLALPDDGIERWLVNGELREIGNMSHRSPDHCSTVANLTFFLQAWMRQQSHPRPKVFTSDVTFRLSKKPPVVVGTDVAVVSNAQLIAKPANARLFDGPPKLAAEVASPSDTVEDIQDKVNLYLANGTPLVWHVNPANSTVMVFRPNHAPVLFNSTQELNGDPELPGFKIKVADIFE